MEEAFDLIVVGGGPAGLSAAIYGGSRGLKIAVVEQHLTGGRARTSPRIENYPGFPDGIEGEELTHRFKLQADKFGAKFVSGTAVGVRDSGAMRIVRFGNGVEMKCRAILLTTGLAPREPDLSGMKEFKGNGVSFAPPPVSHSYPGESVCVFGGGNAAAQAALFLAQKAGCARVDLIIPEPNQDGTAQYLRARINVQPNIIVRLNSQLKGFWGTARTGLADFMRDGVSYTIETRLLFVIIGGDPGKEMQEGPDLDSRGYVMTGETDRLVHDHSIVRFNTSIRGVFAAGDIRRGSVKCIACANGEAVAAIEDIREFLRETN